MTAAIAPAEAALAAHDAAQAPQHALQAAQAMSISFDLSRAEN